MAVLEQARRILPGFWLGLLVCVAALAAPAAFGELERAEAARYVNQLFLREAYASLLIGTTLLALERMRARRRVLAGLGSQFSGEMGLALGAVFCTVLGYFAVQPMLPGAKMGQGPLTFGQLHALSVVFFAVKGFLAAVLAWRTVGPVPSPAT